MPRQYAAAILETDVTLQSRDGHVADESGGADQQAGRYCNHPSHRRKPFCEQDRKQCSSPHAAEKTFPGLVRTYFGNDFFSPQHFPPDVLCDVVELSQKNQKQDQAGASRAWIVSLWQNQ